MLHIDYRHSLLDWIIWFTQQFDYIRESSFYDFYLVIWFLWSFYIANVNPSRQIYCTPHLEHIGLLIHLTSTRKIHCLLHYRSSTDAIFLVFWRI